VPARLSLFFRPRGHARELRPAERRRENFSPKFLSNVWRNNNVTRPRAVKVLADFREGRKSFADSFDTIRRGPPASQFACGHSPRKGDGQRATR
jgi:hypothetical protein